MRDGDAAFRDEVRRFFETVPLEWRSRARFDLRIPEADLKEYHRMLAAKGWGAPTWPAEYGGPGWSTRQYIIFEQEAARANAPILSAQGLELIGPIIFSYGTPEQKARYLPRIISAEDWWCQGYSEPNAGSDLAAIRTRAEKHAAGFRINGQKIWTSYAHISTHIFVLARTSREDRKQRGISLFLVDLGTPGIQVRPTITLEEEHHVNEVFFDNVEVPFDALVGEEGKGWTYGKALLKRERFAAAGACLRLRQQVCTIRELAGSTHSGGRPLIVHPGFALKLAQLEIEVRAIETMSIRLLLQSENDADNGGRGSMLKLRWSELFQAATAMQVEAAGHEAARFVPLADAPGAIPAVGLHAMQGALYARATSIYGGTSEIQKNIIAQRMLGL